MGSRGSSRWVRPSSRASPATRSRPGCASSRAGSRTRSAAPLYGRFARRVNDRGEEFFPGEPSWSENDLAQAIARQPGGRAWYVLDERALQQTVRERTVAEMVEQARAAGGEVVPVEGGGVKVRVYAAVTHTLGGLRIDTGARVLDEAGEPISGLYAAGVDAGGVALGGYASGLAQ